MPTEYWGRNGTFKLRGNMISGTDFYIRFQEILVEVIGDSEKGKEHLTLHPHFS